MRCLNFDEADAMKMAIDFPGWIASGPTTKARPEAVNALAELGLVTTRPGADEFHPLEFRLAKLTGSDGEDYTIAIEKESWGEYYELYRLSDYWCSDDSFGSVREAVDALGAVETLDFSAGIPAIVLGCILKTRAIDETELWGKYEKTCKRNSIMPLPGQVRTSIGRLHAAGLVKFTDERKKIIRA